MTQTGPVPSTNHAN